MRWTCQAQQERRGKGKRDGQDLGAKKDRKREVAKEVPYGNLD
jgi:hypothetical protein